MKLVLEFDDFSPKNSNFGLLEDLRDHYEGFKVTCFTVPWEIRWGEPTPIIEAKFDPWVRAVKVAAPWLEIALHGLTHVPMEFARIDEEKAFKWISVGEKMLINRGITYAKIFKAPHWQISPGGEKAAFRLGFQVVKDGYYHWNLKDDLPAKLLKSDQVVIGHGHVQNTMGNGLEEVMPRLLKLPTDTKFMWLSEHLKADRVNSEEVLKKLKEALN